jgi:hypothetical protein
MYNLTVNVEAYHTIPQCYLTLLILSRILSTSTPYLLTLSLFYVKSTAPSLPL